jgi:hypothetical protein
MVRLFAENFMHEIGGVPGAELFQQIGSMKIDRARADAERPRGLLAGGAPNDLGQRNTFFWSQSLMPGEWLRQDVQRSIQPPDFPACLSSGVSRNSQLPFRRTMEH